MRRRMGFVSVLLLALLMSSLPAGAAFGGLDDLISVDTVSGEIFPLGIAEPTDTSDSRDLIVGVTGVESSTFAGFDVVWGGFLGGSYGTDILLYDRDNGRFEFRTVGSDGNTYEFWSATGTRGWSHVVPGDYDGNGITDLLFYRASDGLMRFYTIEADGTFRAMTPAMFGTRGWTQMVPGDYDDNGTDDLMWYRARDGLMRFYTVDAPRFIPMTDVAYGTRNWGQIPSGDFDGDGRDDLMYYRPSDGLYRFYTLTGAGRFIPISTANHTDPDWFQILSGRFDKPRGDDLVFYMPGVITAKGFNPSYLYPITDDAEAPFDQNLTVLNWDPFN